MLLKILGAIMVLFASAMMGRIMAKSFARRPQELRELQGAFQLLENEMDFMSNVLRDSFQKISTLGTGTRTVFFQSAGDILKERPGTSASEAWRESVRKNISSTSLNKEDEAVLTAFGDMLGCSDVEGQIKNIRLTISQLKLQEQKAEEERQKNEKLHGSLGVLGGLAVVIILI